jgi:hypothetical protein
MSVRLEPLVPESPEREETHLSDGNRLTVVLIMFSKYRQVRQIQASHFVRGCGLADKYSRAPVWCHTGS